MREGEREGEGEIVETHSDAATVWSSLLLSLRTVTH